MEPLHGLRRTGVLGTPEPGADRRLHGVLDYFVSLEIKGNDHIVGSGDSKIGFTDCYLSTRLGRLGEIRYGKVKEPIIYEIVGDAANLQQQECILSPTFAPTRNIGVRLANTAAGDRITWTVGWFNDWYLDDQAFEDSGNQFIGRLTGLPHLSDDGANDVHLGLRPDPDAAQEDAMGVLIVAMTSTALVGLLALALALPLEHARHRLEQDAQAVPSIRMADGKMWTARNLDVAVEPSYCYEGIDDNCRRYGRLYTWASASRACAALGPGWRLPSNDEWRELGRHYGGIRQDSADLGRAAYDAIKEGGSSKFDALLGGGRAPDGTYARAEAHGFFWSASESDAAHAWFYNVGRNGQSFGHHAEGEKDRGLSVRCVRD